MEKEWLSDRELWKTRIDVNLELIVTNRGFKTRIKSFVSCREKVCCKMGNSESLQFYWKLCCEVGQLETAIHRATPPRKQQCRIRCVLFVRKEHICMNVQNFKHCFLYLSEIRNVVMKIGRHSKLSPMLFYCITSVLHVPALVQSAIITRY